MNEIFGATKDLHVLGTKLSSVPVAIDDGHERLDFTVIGSVVNEVGRLEPLTKALKVGVVMSEDLTVALGAPLESSPTLRTHSLKDVDGEIGVFAVAND